MSAPAKMLVLVGFTAVFDGTSQTFKPGDTIVSSTDSKHADAIWNNYNGDSYVMNYASIGSSLTDELATVIKRRSKGDNNELAIRLLIGRIKDLL